MSEKVGDVVGGRQCFLVQQTASSENGILFVEVTPVADALCVVAKIKSSGSEASKSEL
jgi:hypothetical protein